MQKATTKEKNSIVQSFVAARSPNKGHVQSPKIFLPLDPCPLQIYTVNQKRQKAKAHHKGARPHKMTSNAGHRISHALSPEQQSDYLNATRFFRLTAFGPFPDPATDAAQSHISSASPKEQRFVRAEDVFQKKPKRKPDFHETLLDKIERQYQRACAAARLSFKGLREGPEEKALRKLRREIEREERRVSHKRNKADKERVERELRTAKLVSRGVKEELRRRSP